MVEFYAGAGNLSRYCRLCGLRTASLDILYGVGSGRTYGSNCMDILSPSGFAFLGNNYMVHVILGVLYCLLTLDY